MNSQKVPRELIVHGLRHDLPLMVLSCQRLPCGGLPAAGLLADHCNVVIDALEFLLESDGRNFGLDSLVDERSWVVDQLGQVADRVDRLYSAERPGGLDHLDSHLARLRIAVDRYLEASNRLEIDHPGLNDTDETPIGRRTRGVSANRVWAAGYGHCRRARLVAWATVASGIRPNRVGCDQPLATRAWLRLGVVRRARRRAAILPEPARSRDLST